MEATAAVLVVSRFWLGSVMSVAFWSIHRSTGSLLFARPDEGGEYAGESS